MGVGQSTSATNERGEDSHDGPYENSATMKDRSKKKSINLLRGWPSASLLPAAALRAASQTALSDPDIWVPGLEYAPDPGYQPLREALARWLGRFYEKPIADATADVSGPGQDERERGESRGIREEADRITITGGASQSLACLLQSFTDPAHTLAVWVVAPCYFLACPIFADAGFAGRLRAVPEDDEGVDVTILEREMSALEEKSGGNGRYDNSAGHKDPGRYRKIYRHVVYCVPAYSNPSGRTTTLSRRQALVDVARRHDALVICDDVYDMLQWRVESPSSPPSFPGTTSSQRHQQESSPRPPPTSDTDLHRALLPRIADLDMARGRSPHDPPGRHFGHAVSNGSFSKLVAPGTRTGWTYSTADLALGVSRTGSTRSGGAASQLAATVVCQLLLSPAPSSSPSSGGRLPGSREGEGGGREGECILDAHIRHTLLPSYARRHAVLMRAVRDVLVPLGVRVELDGERGGSSSSSSNSSPGGIYGGYFVWLTLPSPAQVEGGTDASISRTWPTARAIADRCSADEDLKIGNGEMFAVYDYEEEEEEEEEDDDDDDEDGKSKNKGVDEDGNDDIAPRFDDAIRLCFAWEDEEDLVDGVERLGRVIRRMLDEGPESWVTKGGKRVGESAK